jgi:outer membrane protein
MNNKPLLALFLAFNSFFCSAQQTDSLTNAEVWSLKKCIDFAMANNLVLKRGETNVEYAHLDYKQSQWARFPSLNASGSYGVNWGRSLNPVTYEFTTQQLESFNPNASSSVTLFNGLRIQNTISQNKNAYEASRQDFEKTKNDVMLNITSLYINVIFYKEQLQNARFLLLSTQTQLERVKKQVAAGALARSEELNIDAQVATNEVNLINQENSLNLALLQLKQALQLPASTPLDVELLDIRVDDLVLDQSRDEIYDVAQQLMPEIKSANLRVLSSSYAVKAARGNLLPRLSLSGSVNSNYSSASDRTREVPTGETTTTPQQIGYVQGSNTPVIRDVVVPSFDIINGYGYREQLKDNFYRSVGLTLSIPIFNGMQARYAWQRSKVSRDVAEITAAETRNTLRQNIETAYNNAIASSKTYNSNLRQVQAREEAFRMMELRYNSGAANYFEYTVAQNDLFRARTDMTRAKYDFIFRKKILDFYQGKPLEY